jgi:ABC-type transport system substrate-binding protein
MMVILGLNARKRNTIVFEFTETSISQEPVNLLVRRPLVHAFRKITKGLTVLAFICLVSLRIVPLSGAQAPLFSVTLIVPNTQQVRVQYASIIADNMIKLGIDAKVEYENFTTILSRAFTNSTGPLFDEGGYDILFIGWSWTNPLPDLRPNFDGRPPNVPPTGNNYALYNSSQLNNLLDQLYTSTDLQTQINLVHEWQQIVYDDSPYAYIYEATGVWPMKPNWTFWGGGKTYNPEVTFPDIQHFSGGKTFTFAVSSPFTAAPPLSPFGDLNPALTLASSDSFSAISIYWPIVGSGAGLLDVDPRDDSYYPALATNITHSPDGLDWTVHIRKGALWQSGVEITSDDFVWTRWALFNPKTASTLQPYDINNLGNVIDFTFLNGTTVTVDNRQSPNDVIRHGWWRAVDRYTFEFHLSQPFPWAREEYAGFTPLPKHIMEKFAPETWDNQPFSTAKGPYTYTWDIGEYGGTGSYTAVGPVGDGPYYLQSYNFTTNVATLKKFPQYWNATGLQALGQFTVDTYNVVTIPDRSTILQDLSNGQIDGTYNSQYFSGSDLPTLRSMGLNVILAPALGWQEMGFNMKHPVFGTGVDTSLGRSDPSRAAEAARDVRKAISHLIPRDQIVNDLLGGAGVPLASFLGPGWGIWYNRDLTPDSYDNNTAAALLRAAGYTVGGIPGVTVTQPSSFFWAAGGGIIAAVVLTSAVLVTVRKRRTHSGATARLKMDFANLDDLLLTVNPQVPTHDRVLVTVMLTDIVDSTARAANLGDREWQVLLNQHFDLVRKELSRFSGREVATTGDGILAVFAGPERAVRCACAIRDELRSLDLEIRAGLHTGEIQLTSTRGSVHVTGIAVHIGARVASQAEPGQILVSSTTKDLTTGTGIKFEDRGMRVLKGVPGEWHLFAVAAA